MTYNIMLVDDNELITRPLSRLLHAHGYDVMVAHSGQEALRKLEKKKPRVILLDIGMHKMDGYEVAKEIKKDPKHARVILIAFTGNNHISHKNKARHCGFHHQISKPAKIEDIVRILNVYDF